MAAARQGGIAHVIAHGTGSLSDRRPNPGGGSDRSLSGRTSGGGRRQERGKIRRGKIRRGKNHASTGAAPTAASAKRDRADLSRIAANFRPPRCVQRNNARA
ncbi:ferrochelatase [Methylorubrum populi]|uniref:Ferrochelatase n=1 Tax=Methylorubrum populi TaxID=223967 RepID=A0A160PFN1_9HYPH|nr:ferrochelatase [Methylorubrum populi]